MDAEHPERILVHIDEKFFRPAEVESLLGDATKAQVQLGWTPEIDFKDLVQEMIEFDCFLP